VSILNYGKKLFVANVGDSRSIILRLHNECNYIYNNYDIELKCNALTIDHKPDNESEA
jgi:serine/threonine protein phosphatase PrpC